MTTEANRDRKEDGELVQVLHTLFFQASFTYSSIHHLLSKLADASLTVPHVFLNLH